MVKPINEIAPEKRANIMYLRAMFDKVLGELMLWGNVTIPQRIYKQFAAYLNNREIKGVHITGEGMRDNVCNYRLGFNVEEYSQI